MSSNEIGIIMKCIKGEEWPTESFKSFVQVNDNPLTMESITITCPVGHTFTLQTAVKKGIIPEDRAQNVINHAVKLKEEWGYQKDGIWKATAQSFLPQEEVVVLNLPCIKCGSKPAQRSLGELPKFVVCLQCYADWFNYDKKSFHQLFDQTHGKPSELLWEAFRDRFLNDQPPLSLRQARKLIEQCRKEAKKRHKERPK